MHIYQFSTSSAVAGFLADRSEPLIVDFHNFTAPELFAGWEPHTEARAALAHDELVLLAKRAELGLADSRFNELDLRRAGYRRTAVLPVLVDYQRVGSQAPSDRRVAAELASLKARGGADILFVGRIVPSKQQHELVKALWAYRRLYDPAARLHLVGGTSSFAYLKALRGFVHDLGLADAVRITGEVSDAALRAYFGAADVYLSLSVHEGFGVPLVEAMAAGVPVVARGVGAVAETVGDGALLLAADDPSYVAAALRRVCTDATLRRRLIDAGRRRVPTLSVDAVSATGRGGSGDGGGTAPMKVAFVTPRYGPQVMGGAETAARQLAEHLVAETAWEAEAYSTCALDPHTWADELEPGDSEINGVPVHRFASAHGRVPDFYALDGRVRLAPQLATRDEGRRWVDYNGPVSPDLIAAVCAADADVVAFYPYLYHPTVAAIGRVPMPAVLHPAAHDEPALYLPVFRGTLRRCRRVLLPHGGRAPVGRADLPGGGEAPDRPGAGGGRIRRCGTLRGRDPRPGRPALHRQCGPGGRAQGLQDAGRVLRHLQGAAPRAVGPGAGRSDFGRARPTPRHRDHRGGGGGRQVGHRQGRAGRRLPLGPRVVLAGRPRGLGGPGARSWSTGPAVPPVSIASAPEGVCGSPPTPSSRRRSTASWPMPTSGPPSGANGRAYVDRFYQWPVLIARYASFLEGVVARGRGTPGLL